MKNRELLFLSAQPDETYFSWQIEVFIENIRSLGYGNEIRVLLFVADGQERNKRNLNLQARYANYNVKFFWYEDKEDYLTKALSVNYVPLIRTYMFEKHFKEYKELSKKAIFYHDSDFIFTCRWNVDQFKNDKVNYLSDTSGYLGAKYFETRKYFVKPELLEEYLSRDILQEAADLVGISKEVIIQNEFCTGGAQHILKDIDHKFWKDVNTDAYKLRKFFMELRTRYFENEKEGFQNGWCGEMWALLWNLWKRKRVVRTPKEMDFAWPEYPSTSLMFCNMYHDTGVNADNQHYLFNKKRDEYLCGQATPYTEDLSYVSEQHASIVYKVSIDNVRNRYYSQQKKD